MLLSPKWRPPRSGPFFFLMIRPPPRSPPFPYTTLFRSCSLRQRQRDREEPVPARDGALRGAPIARSEEHTSELQSQSNLACRLLLEKRYPLPLWEGAAAQFLMSSHGVTDDSLLLLHTAL